MAALAPYEPPRELGVNGKQYRDVLRHDPCAYCRGRGGTLDHIVPRSRLTQPEGPRNLTGACLEHNQAKADRSLLLFLLHRREIHPAT